MGENHGGPDTGGRYGPGLGAARSISPPDSIGRPSVTSPCLPGKGVGKHSLLCTQTEEEMGLVIS